MKLIQKKGFLKKEFELTENILKIKTKSPAETKEWTEKIEYVGEELVYQSKSKAVANIFAYICVGLVALVTYAFFRDGDKAENIWVVLAVYIIFGGIASLIFYTPKFRELHLVGGSVEVTLFPDSPSKEEVDQFVQELINRSKKILVDKYGKVDPDLPEEAQFSQFAWLKNRDVITEEEYERLKQEYKTKKIVY